MVGVIDFWFGIIGFYVKIVVEVGGVDVCEFDVFVFFVEGVEDGVLS